MVGTCQENRATRSGTGSRHGSHRKIVRGLILLSLIGLVRPETAWSQDALPQVVSTRSAPRPSYFVIFPAYYDGEYREALKAFRAEGRAAIKNGPGNHWIDSICFHAMTGECYYQMGQLGLALDHYNAALKLYVAYSEWMLRVQFPPAIRPANLGRVKRVPWGQSQRLARVGQFQDTTLIEQGRLNNIEQVQRGGVVQPPVLYSVSVQEIVRCTSLALRRRRELMGPVGPHDPLSGQLIAVLARRPSRPNHWSEAWIDAQLGLAYAAAGKDAQARTVLEHGVVAAGQFDHPLTPTILLELGRLALSSGDFAAAENYFGEATYAAVNFGDVGVLEEAFTYGLQTHLVANRPGLYPPLATAVAWARAQRLKTLQATLLVLLAENQCALNQPKAAAAALTDARAAMGRTDMPNSKLGARLNYVSALTMYQQASTAEGDRALAAALGFQQSGSLWLFHMGLADGLWRDRGISDRLAMELYSLVLRDPTKADWSHDPLESLSSLVTPHPLLFERWFEVALARNEHERALEIADLARRHRFLSTLEMGGRVHSLRWVLEGPPEMLDQEATLQRQDLLVHFPQYGQLAERTRQIKAQLDAMPLAPGDADGKRRQAALLSELASIGQDQERLLRQIALERVPCEMVFPPKRTTRQVQQALEDGQAILVFFSTTRNLYAFLMTNDRYGYWPVASAGALPNQVAALLRGWGNYEQNKVLVRADLENQSWRQPAGLVLATLMKDSRANLPDICRELVVVPDGLLWYVPFEALEVSDGDATVPLISRMRLRYAPTLGLAIADPRPRRQSGNTAVVLGRLFPRDAAEVSARAFDGLASAVPGAVAVGAPLPAPAAVYASLFDRLIAYRDTTPGDGAYDWSPLEVDGNSAGGKLADWFALPWGGPDEVILPGFHTAAERALKGQAPETAGNEMFLSVCGLMANGARTVLISRWRTGGQTSFDLVREFAQELPHTTAADAWQRSVLVVSDMPLDPALEPRLKHDETPERPKADHPFFWAGYMLIDTGTSPHVADEDQAAKVLVQGAARRPDDQPPAQPAAGVDGEPEEDEEDVP